MAELTPRDDIKKTVSEVLKRAEQLIKQGEFDLALREVARAKSIDPKNVYVLAFEERIGALREQEIRNREAEAAKQHAELELQRKNEDQRKKFEEDRKQREEEAFKAAAARLKAEQQKADQQKNEQQKHREDEESRQRLEEVALARVKAQVEKLSSYRRLLREVWADGATTEEEQKKLHALQTELRISPTDHERLEREVKQECYLEAFKKAWADGSITPLNASLLATLRQSFKISPEEHDRYEAAFLTDLRKHEKTRPNILVIDDDKALLEIIAETISDAGFEVRSFTTSDDAYTSLKARTPDLILCDINLETSTMGGFSFFEKLQEIDELQDVPFIFLTGLTDEVLVRTGKELGVDDYLTKPISDQTLLATIRGKLKRFKKLKDRKKK